MGNLPTREGPCDFIIVESKDGTIKTTDPPISVDDFFFFQNMMKLIL
jgi:hypothetical protein